LRWPPEHRHPACAARGLPGLREFDWRTVYKLRRSQTAATGARYLSIRMMSMSISTSKVEKYVSVFNIGLQNTFVYRWNYFLRALFGLIPLAGTVFLWRAIFKERGGGLHGYDYSSMIYYYLLTILVSNLVTPTEDEWQIAADIREGQINALLTKPMSYLGYRFSIFLSGRLVYTLVTLPPIALIFVYFRDYIVLPQDPMTYLFATISLLMAAFIQFFITYSLAMMAFWVLEISTIVFIVYSFEYFLGGQMFPIDIMPVGVQAVMKWLPFYYELFCPVAIFLERLKGPDLIQALLIQAGWLLLTWMWANAMWKRGLGHYQAVGG
jgi:ABC-2 type transport system permease protein